MATVAWDLTDVRPVGAASARVHRRRRAVALALVVLLAAIGGLGARTVSAGGLAPARSAPSSPAPPSAAASMPAFDTVVVGAGDTVWDLARAHLPGDRSLAAYVAEILRANDVNATALVPGTVLRLPR